MAAPYAGPTSIELVPDIDTMWRFIEWWFERCNRGVIEIGWMVPGTGQLTRFQRFALGDMTILKALADGNREPGSNPYSRASTILEDAPLGHTHDEHVAQAPGLWADMDTMEQVLRAQQVQHMIRPHARTITGRIPHLRYQQYTKTSEPLVTPDFIRDMNRRYQLLYGGDPAVVNPSRLMRVPGSIAWPYKPGRVPELTAFEIASDDRPKTYPISTIAGLLPEPDEPPRRSASQHRGQACAPQSQAGPSWSGVPPAPISAIHALIDKIRAGQGGWHNDVIRLVAHWVAVGRPDFEILLACEALTLPGWTIEQTRKEVQAAIDGARRKWAIPDPTFQEEEDGWPEPVDLLASPDLTGVPELKRDHLPDAIAPFVFDTAERMGVDPASVALTALVSCAAVATDDWTIQPKRNDDTWTEAPRIWGAIVGDPSVMKTPVIKACTAYRQAGGRTASRICGGDAAVPGRHGAVEEGEGGRRAQASCAGPLPGGKPRDRSALGSAA